MPFKMVRKNWLAKTSGEINILQKASSVDLKVECIFLQVRFLNALQKIQFDRSGLFCF